MLTPISSKIAKTATGSTADIKEENWMLDVASRVQFSTTTCPAPVPELGQLILSLLKILIKDQNHQKDQC